MRRYEPYWEELKEKGMIQLGIEFNPKIVDAFSVYKRIRQAIKKEKTRDTEYKDLYPAASLKFARTEISAGKINIKIVLHNTISSITVNEF